MHKKWQAFLKVLIFVNSSFHKWILSRIDTEIDSMMKNLGAVFMLQLLKHIQILIFYWLISSGSSLIEVFFSEHWWTVNKQVQEGNWNAKLFMYAQFILLRIYYKRNTSKGLQGTICFRFCMINSNFLRLISNKFHCPNIDTADNRALSLLIHK
jgi:hypothetical protein